MYGRPTNGESRLLQMYCRIGPWRYVHSPQNIVRKCTSAVCVCAHADLMNGILSLFVILSFLLACVHLSWSSECYLGIWPPSPMVCMQMVELPPVYLCVLESLVIPERHPAHCCVKTWPAALWCSFRCQMPHFKDYAQSRWGFIANYLTRGDHLRCLFVIIN